MKTIRWLCTVSGVALAILLAACGGPTAPAAPMTLQSSAFSAGAETPQQYTCDGQDISPPLQWSEPPAGTLSFALVMDDPDAGDFRHWVIYNLPGTARALPEAVPTDGELADGSLQGQTSWGPAGYGGPCPPSGTHHYAFHLYALDAVLELKAGASFGQLLKAMQGHILAEAEFVAVYTRQN